MQDLWTGGKMRSQRSNELNAYSQPHPQKERPGTVSNARFSNPHRCINDFRENFEAERKMYRNDIRAAELRYASYGHVLLKNSAMLDEQE